MWGVWGGVGVWGRCGVGVLYEGKPYDIRNKVLGKVILYYIVNDTDVCCASTYRLNNCTHIETFNKTKPYNTLENH